MLWCLLSFKVECLKEKKVMVEMLIYAQISPTAATPEKRVIHYHCEDTSPSPPVFLRTVQSHRLTPAAVLPGCTLRLIENHVSEFDALQFVQQRYRQQIRRMSMSHSVRPQSGDTWLLILSHSSLEFSSRQ